MAVTESNSKVKLTKNQKRRLRKKEHKQTEASVPKVLPQVEKKPDNNEATEQEIVQSTEESDFRSQLAKNEEFKGVLEKFMSTEDMVKNLSVKRSHLEEDDGFEVASTAVKSETAEQNEEEPKEEVKLSKKKRKLMKRLTVYQLKNIVSRPEVVEDCDVTAKDPRLLVFLKSYRNTVPVPQHWNSKHKYLSTKRACDKIPYVLPDYIAETGISRTRQALAEAERGKSMKAIARERMNPKLHRFDLDYDLLEKAFNHVTKPDMTTYGDIYYEGKEMKVRMVNKIPGKLSENLRTALSLEPNAPPPWLSKMKQVGPPPSYPGLPIPGVNAPIPQEILSTTMADQWGSLPLNQFGLPMFGYIETNNPEVHVDQVTCDTSLWGALPELQEESENSELELLHQEEEEEEEEKPATPAAPETSKQTSKFVESFIPKDTEEDKVVPLRKTDENQPLYVELVKKKVTDMEGSIMAPEYEYVMPDNENANEDTTFRKEANLSNITEVAGTTVPEETKPKKKLLAKNDKFVL